MRFERHVSDTGQPALGAVLGAVLVLASGLAAVWLRLGLPLPACVFRQWTGLPCPTCGSTRMVEAVLGGDLLGALAQNPMVFVGLSLIAAWALLSAGRLALGMPSWRIVLAPSERLALRAAAVTALGLNWAWLVWKA